MRLICVISDHCTKPLTSLIIKKWLEMTILVIVVKSKGITDDDKKQTAMCGSHLCWLPLLWYPRRLLLLPLNKVVSGILIKKLSYLPMKSEGFSWCFPFSVLTNLALLQKRKVSEKFSNKRTTTLWEQACYFFQNQMSLLLTSNHKCVTRMILKNVQFIPTCCLDLDLLSIYVIGVVPPKSTVK